MVKYLSILVLTLLFSGESDAQYFRGGQSNYAPPPEHIKYLNPRCRSLYDAIKLAHVRGSNSDTVAGMTREYAVQCQEEERAAYGRANQDRLEQRVNKQSAINAEKAEQERAMRSASMKTEQCRESKRIINSKRARTDLTDGERNDLDRFEENFKARCG